MKNTTGNKMRLGIFVTAGLVLFIAAIYFIGERQQLFSKTFRVSGIFKDISGLQIGNNVRFSGINVGVVEAIEQVTDSTVKVDMKINEHSKKFMKKSSQAIIGSDGLMGNKIVVISPGMAGGPEIAHNDIIATTRQVSLDEIMVKVKVTVDNAADLTDDLAAIFGNIRDGRGTVGKLFSDEGMAKNLDQTLVNIKQSSSGLKQNMDAAGHSFLLRGYLKRKARREERKKEKKED